MTPPFQPGDRVTVRDSFTLGALVVERCEWITETASGNPYWWCMALPDRIRSLSWSGPATSLIKVEDEARREA